MKVERYTDGVPDDVLVGHVVEMVNKAYERGEKGMWNDGFSRTSSDEVKQLFERELVLLCRDEGDRILGSVVCDTAFKPGLGEISMMAVSEEDLGGEGGQEEPTNHPTTSVEPNHLH